MSWWKSALNGIKSVALPAIGFALGGPAGAAAGGALSGAIGNGKPKLGNIAGGAITGGLGGGVASAGGQGVLKTVGGALLHNAPALLGAGALAQGQATQNSANKQADAALKLRQQQYADFAPIRALGIQGLQNTQRPDLTSVYRNAQNPFA